MSQPLSRCSESQQIAALSLSATQSALVRPFELLNLKCFMGPINPVFLATVQSPIDAVLHLDFSRRTQLAMAQADGRRPVTADATQTSKEAMFSLNRGSLTVTALWYCAVTEYDCSVAEGGTAL